MNKPSEYNPNWASVPGDTIADILHQKKLSLTEFSRLMDTSIQEIESLLNGIISINHVIAQKLASTLGGSVPFWLRREEHYRTYVQLLKNVEAEKWLQELPTKDMIKYRWISSNQNLIEACLNYFNVPDVQGWENKYSDIASPVLFRKSAKLHSSLGSLATWIRQGEIQAANSNAAKWDPTLLQSHFDQIKQLSRLKDPKVFLPRLGEICAKCGISLSIAPTPSHCAASGVAKFLSTERAMILLSFRYKTDDQFWFTFFHEVAHLILHSHGSVFIEETSDEKTTDKKELEANEFAANVLISPEIRSTFINKAITEADIKMISKNTGISLGIVVGQLQHLKLIPLNYFNSFKKKYNWQDINASLEQK
jgi:HTH-type transcriptional regulator / antitoxin HigA